MQRNPRVLIVDDDCELRKVIGEVLTPQGFDIFEAEDGAGMREILKKHTIDVIVLDIMIPHEDGLSIARSLNDRSDLRIIMVSALGSEMDRVVGLEVGADDYLVKPVSPRELMARIRAVLRRSHSSSADSGSMNAYLFAGWKLDPVRRLLRDPKGVITTLSEGDFSLLLALVEHPQQVLNRDQLLDFSKGVHSETFDRAIDTQVSRLRRKLGSRVRGELILTVRNEGYIFIPEVSRA